MKLKHLLLVFVFALTTACSIESITDDPYETLVDLVQTNEGLWVYSGQDLNRNGILEETEINNRAFVKNGEDGADGQDGEDGQDGYNSITYTEDIEGGYIIYHGLDINRNDTLEENEITSQITIYHGQNGEDGEDGEDGKDGADGYNTLMNIVQITSEMETDCEYGGIRIFHGLDTDRDNILSDEEVTGYADVCKCVCEQDCDTPYYNIEIVCCPDQYEDKGTATPSVYCPRKALKITKGIVGKPELETIEIICFD